MRLILLIVIVLASLPFQTIAQRRGTPPKRPLPDLSDLAKKTSSVEADIPDAEQGWRLATVSDGNADGDRTIAYYNKRSLTRPTRGIARVWVKFVDEVGGETKLSGLISLSEYDCSSRRSRLLSSTRYDDKGDVINGRNSTRPSEWDYVAPDTVGEGLLEIVCEGREDMEHFYVTLARDTYRDGLMAEREGRYQDALDSYKTALGYVPSGYNRKIQVAIYRVAAKIP
jgi:hypothetical protein